MTVSLPLPAKLPKTPVATLALQGETLGGASAAVAQMAQPSAEPIEDIDDYEYVCSLN